MLIPLVLGGQLPGKQIHIAVASNFTNAMKEIAQSFETKSGDKVILTFGSTGKLYTQIKNGAPYDAFFSADIKRPKLLEEEGVALPGSRFTYATGKIVLWSPKPGVVDTNGSVLKKGNFRYLAIAKPKLAPYGKAAKQVMQNLGVWGALQDRLAKGENIGQAFQYVYSGNAELGFVAYSQIKSLKTPNTGSLWEPPQDLYNPIKQQAVLLKDNTAAKQFLAFIKSKKARQIIQKYGYDTP